MTAILRELHLENIKELLTIQYVLSQTGPPQLPDQINSEVEKDKIENKNES